MPIIILIYTLLFFINAYSQTTPTDLENIECDDLDFKIEIKKKGVEIGLQEIGTQATLPENILIKEYRLVFKYRRALRVLDLVEGEKYDLSTGIGLNGLAINVFFIGLNLREDMGTIEKLRGRSDNVSNRTYLVKPDGKTKFDVYSIFKKLAVNGYLIDSVNGDNAMDIDTKFMIINTNIPGNAPGINEEIRKRIKAHGLNVQSRRTFVLWNKSYLPTLPQYFTQGEYCLKPLLSDRERNIFKVRLDYEEATQKIEPLTDIKKNLQINSSSDSSLEVISEGGEIFFVKRDTKPADFILTLQNSEFFVDTQFKLSSSDSLDSIELPLRKNKKDSIYYRTPATPIFYVDITEGSLDRKAINDSIINYIKNETYEQIDDVLVYTTNGHSSSTGGKDDYADVLNNIFLYEMLTPRFYQDLNEIDSLKENKRVILHLLISESTYHLISRHPEELKKRVKRLNMDVKIMYFYVDANVSQEAEKKFGHLDPRFVIVPCPDKIPSLIN